MELGFESRSVSSLIFIISLDLTLNTLVIISAI